MKDPIKILVKNEQLTLDGIKQFYISMEKDEQKFPTLLQLIQELCYCSMHGLHQQKRKSPRAWLTS
jgi:superfamily II DNA/RNA helicase